MESFLNNINMHWKVMPDYRPKDVEQKLRAKCQVSYFPLEVPHGRMLPSDYVGDDQLLHIVWPHRWYRFILFKCIFIYLFLIISFIFRGKEFSGSGLTFELRVLNFVTRFPVTFSSKIE